MTPDTLAFLDSVRDAEGPTPNDEERVLQNLRRAIATGAVAGACVETSWLSKTLFSKAWVSKAWLTSGGLKGGVLALGLVAASAVPGSQVTRSEAVDTRATAPPQTHVVEPARAHTTPALAARLAPPASTATAQHASRASSAPPPPPTRVTPPLAADAPSASSLEELQVLSQVQAALKRGDGAGALRLLNEPMTGSAQLLAERDAARVLALCATGRRAEAERAAVRFAERHPASLHLAVVRRSCAEKNGAR